MHFKFHLSFLIHSRDVGDKSTRWSLRIRFTNRVFLSGFTDRPITWAGHKTRKPNSKSKEIWSHFSLSLSLSMCVCICWPPTANLTWDSWVLISLPATLPSRGFPSSHNIWLAATQPHWLIRATSLALARHYLILWLPLDDRAFNTCNSDPGSVFGVRFPAFLRFRIRIQIQ